MKKLKPLVAAILIASFGAAPLAGLAADQQTDQKTDQKADQKQKAKPYTLKTCPVSGEKLGEMGDPYAFVYKDREIKLCCKSCLKDFQKTPAKFIKKIEQEEAKAKKKDKA
jgi:hypothetical protein